MVVVLRSAGAIFTAIVAAAATTVMSITASAGAATALLVGGTTPTNVLPDFVMSRLFNGYYEDDFRINIPYPGQIWPVTGNPAPTAGQSVWLGATALEVAIRLIPGPKTVGGLSLGASVVNEVMRRLDEDPNAPSKDELTFLIYGDDTRGNGILAQFFNGMYVPILDMFIQPPPETQYDVTVIIPEYDGYSDFPDRPSNLYAVANAIAGMFSVHVTGAFADLAAVPASNITTTTNSKNGVTTTYLVPTNYLPLLLPLRIIGVPESIVSAMEEELKPIVDSGYSRNDSAEQAVGSGQSTAMIDPVEELRLQQQSTPQLPSVQSEYKTSTVDDEFPSAVDATTATRPKLRERADIAERTSRRGSLDDDAIEQPSADTDKSTLAANEPGSASESQPSTVKSASAKSNDDNAEGADEGAVSRRTAHADQNR
jgi:PE-PPE domain